MSHPPDVKTVMKEHFLALDRAAHSSGRTKVAWCTSVGPAEILRAMGFEVFFPENHGAMLGATRMSSETIPEANSRGYSPDICSYLTSDIGAFLKKMTPLTRAYGIESVPRPDVLVYNTNQCKDVMHWFEFFGREFQAPVIGIHSPNHLPEVTEAHVECVVGQFKEMVEKLLPIAGVRLDPARLRETLALSHAATELWKKVLETARARPSPLTFFDGTILMGPIVVLRGTPAAHEFYRHLLSDFETQIKSGAGAIPDERHRVYWDGMPIWGRLRATADLFAANRAAVVASTYCNSWIFSDFDPDDPWRSMARAYLKIFINRNDAYKLRYIAETVRDFGAQGVIFHESKTCPNNANSQYNLPGRLAKEHGIRSAVIHGDLCDLRCYSDEQSATVIEAFLENL